MKILLIILSLVSISLQSMAYEATELNMTSGRTLMGSYIKSEPYSVTNMGGKLKRIEIRVRRLSGSNVSIRPYVILADGKDTVKDLTWGVDDSPSVPAGTLFRTKDRDGLHLLGNIKSFGFKVSGIDAVVEIDYVKIDLIQ